MKIVGLTGSIGMGKTTTSAMFKDLGVPVWDADSAVHRLYARGGLAVEPILRVFPAVHRSDGGIDRNALSQLVFDDPAKLAKLESIVHPLVGQDRALFMAEARATDAPIAIADVPLLFETGGQKYVDAVIVVSCDSALQRQRVLARPNMTAEKLDAILARQTPDAQKRDQADFVITTDTSLADTGEQVRLVYEKLAAIAGDQS